MRRIWYSYLSRAVAFVPKAMIERAAAGEQLEVGQTCRIQAATLFVDIAQFTDISERLAYKGAEGIRALNGILAHAFSHLVDLIHDNGGSISHFYGDALMAYFPESAETDNVALRALTAAQQIQRLTLRKPHYALHFGSHSIQVKLHLRLGVAYGQCVELVVGRPDGSREFVLAGQAVEDAVRAQNLAESGEVVASRAVRILTGVPGSGDFDKVTTPLAPVADRIVSNWSRYTWQQQAAMVRLARRFSPPVHLLRMLKPPAVSQVRFCRATSMFVQFEGIDFSLPDAGQLMQDYFGFVAGLVARYSQGRGIVNRVLTGDKGNQIHIFWRNFRGGTATAEAVCCAQELQRCRPEFISQQRIGIATGVVSEGQIGSAHRSEYTLIGHAVNVSALITQICPPGSILVDTVTAHESWGTVDFQRRSNRLLKRHRLLTPMYEVMPAFAPEAEPVNWPVQLLGLLGS